MKKIKIFVAVFMSVCISFSVMPKVFAYQFSTDYPSYTVYVEKNIQLLGSSTIKGDAYSSSGNINLTTTDSSNTINGNLTVDQNSNIILSNNSQITGTINRGQNLPFSIDNLNFQSPPNISRYIESMQCSYYPRITISEDTHFGSLSISGDTIIDVSASDRIIVADQLTITGGSITLSGNNSLYLFVNNHVNIQNSTIFNSLEKKDKAHLIIKGSLNINAYTELYCNIYNYTGSINVNSGGSKIYGNIISTGSSTVFKNNCKVYGFVYSPYANVNMESNSYIYGKLLAKSLKSSGDSHVINAPIDLKFPPLIFIPQTLPSQDYVNGILGEYFDTEITTNPSAKRLTRIDDAVQFNWMYGSPDDVIEPDYFSVKWTGYIEVPESGSYVFSTYSDDGIRVKIGGNQIIDRWGLINLEYTVSSPINLEAGIKYSFEMHYQEQPINSTVFLFWKKDSDMQSLVPPSAFFIDKTVNNMYKIPIYSNSVVANGTGLTAEYYNGGEALYNSNPVAVNNIDSLYFSWGNSLPYNFTSDDYSAKFSGYIEAKYSEKLNLHFTVDDGIRVYINNQLVLDKWIPNSLVTYTVPINVTVGEFYKLDVEYNNLFGPGSIGLMWSSEAQQKEVIPKKYLYRSLPQS